MKRFIPAMLVAAAAAMALWMTGCPKSCGPANCDGCCDATNTCQPSSKDTCGVQGDVCNTCNAIQSCVLGACVFGGNGGNTTGNHTTSHTAATSASASGSNTSSASGSGSTEGTTGSSSEGTTGRQSSTSTTGESTSSTGSPTTGSTSTASSATSTTTGSTGGRCFNVEETCEGRGPCCAGLYCSTDTGVCTEDGFTSSSSSSNTTGTTGRSTSSSSSSTSTSTSTSTGTHSSSASGTTGACYPSGTFLGGSGPDSRCCSGYVDGSGFCNAPPGSSTGSTGTTGRSSSSSSSGSTGAPGTVCASCSGTSAGNCQGGLICYHGFCDTPNSCQAGDPYCGGRGCTGVSCACGQPTGSTSGSSSTGGTTGSNPNASECSPCTASSDCPAGGACVLETSGATSGYCAVGCLPFFSTCTDTNSTCTQFTQGSGTVDYCYPTSGTCVQ